MQEQSPNYALVQRPATRKAEALVLLAGNTLATGPVKVEWTRKVHILSVYASVSPVGNPVLDVPTIDDIMVAVQLNGGADPRLTSRYNTVQANGVASLPNVTLGSYRDSNGGAQILDLELRDASPSLQLEFTWKRDPATGVVYQDVLVGMVFNYNFLE
jgi:hypothetical protein